MAVQWQANSTLATATTGALTANMPSNIGAGDILLCFVESANQAITLSTANGFAELVTQAGTGTAGSTLATRLAIYWKRAVGGDAAPVFTAVGNHQDCVVMRFSGCLA